MKNNQKYQRCDNTFFAPYPQHSKTSESSLYSALDTLHITALNAHYYNCGTSWHLKTRTLGNSYWSYIVAGEGRLTLAGTESNIKKGDFILFPSSQEHSIEPLNGSNMAMINVHFNAHLYGNIDICSALELGGIIKNTTAHLAGISLEAARLYSLTPPGWNAYIKSLITTQLFDIILTASVAQTSLSQDLKKLLKMQPALELIEQNISNAKLHTEDLAQALQVSEVYTRKLFKALFKVSPTSFIHSRRIEYACSLLRSGDKPIKSIARASGFNDLAFFYRIFSRTMKTTPAQYRESPQF